MSVIETATDYMWVELTDEFRDGGTISVKTSNGTFYIDHRARTKTPGSLWTDYPGNVGSIMITDPIVVDRLINALVNWRRRVNLTVECVLQKKKFKDIVV